MPHENDTGCGGGIVFWLAEVCKQAREDRDLKPVEVAAAVRMHPSTFTRFEAHEGSKFAGLERLVEAYAAETGTSANELWRRATDASRAGRLDA